MTPDVLMVNNSTPRVGGDDATEPTNDLIGAMSAVFVADVNLTAATPSLVVFSNVDVEEPPRTT